MANMYVTLTGFAGSTPAYWKNNAWVDNVNGTVALAFMYGSDFPNLTGSTITLAGIKGESVWKITGVYKAGFNYQNGRVKDSHLIVTLTNISGAKTVGHAGFALMLATGLKPTDTVKPADAYLVTANSTGNGAATSPTTAAKKSDVFGLADFLERATWPLLLLCGAVVALYVWIKR